MYIVIKSAVAQFLWSDVVVHFLITFCKWLKKAPSPDNAGGIDFCSTPQAHGGMGVCQDTFLPKAYANRRTLRIADGPDEVHMGAVAKHEFRKSAKL